ncbi:hypothetical protein PBOI14_39610 [Pseudomonas sp. Boi14]|nr:hypothetical protein PBOI14_39610 [Pseudomonas sp. Boi14]
MPCGTHNRTADMNLKLNLKRLLGNAYLHSVGRARLSEAGWC